MHALHSFAFKRRLVQWIRISNSPRCLTGWLLGWSPRWSRGVRGWLSLLLAGAILGWIAWSLIRSWLLLNGLPSSAAWTDSVRPSGISRDPATASLLLMATDTSRPLSVLLTDYRAMNHDLMQSSDAWTY